MSTGLIYRNSKIVAQAWAEDPEYRTFLRQQIYRELKEAGAEGCPFEDNKPIMGYEAITVTYYPWDIAEKKLAKMRTQT